MIHSLRSSKLILILVLASLSVSSVVIIRGCHAPRAKFSPNDSLALLELKADSPDKAKTKIAIRLANEADFDALMVLRDRLVSEYFKPQVLDPGAIKALKPHEKNMYEALTPEFFYNIQNGGFEAYRYWYVDTFKKAFRLEDGWGLMVAVNQETGQPVGLLLFTTKEYPTKKLRNLHDSAEIRYFIVDETMRGKGVGKALVKAVLQYCLKQHPQLKRWEVKVMRWHNGDSIAAYERMGFTPMKQKYNESCLDLDYSSGVHYHLLFQLTPENLLSRYGKA